MKRIRLSAPRQKLPRAAAVCAALAAFFLVAVARTNEIPTAAPEASSAEELTRHVRTLAADEMTGRGVDTPGIVLARDYIAGEFKRYGLAPGGDNGTYFQRFDVVAGVEAKMPSAARLGKNAGLVLDEDWNPLGVSASETVESEVVFAGYGITAKDYDYDDYAGIDVKGKIALVLRYEPPPKDDKSPFRVQPQASQYAPLVAKVSNARDHGAAGMILVDLSPKEGQKELIPVRRLSGARGQTNFVAAQIRREIVERALETEGVSLRALKAAIDREEKPHSLALPALSAALMVKLEKITRAVDNVVGILPGADPDLKPENVVVGAHYDHIGLGHFGASDAGAEDQIHHGADDNASGTAVMMSAAARLSRAPERPARTIVFVAFTAEELGLFGSRYFVAHPPFPLSSTKAMINLDMVGRMRDNRVSVGAVDSASEFPALITRATAGLDATLKPGGGSTDHVSFFEKKIPAVHFTTGGHPDYHRPSDTWDKLNIPGMAKIADSVVALAREIAGRKEGLTFKKPASKEG